MFTPSGLIGSWVALGLAMGSFASVLVARIPERLGIHGKSQCLSCKREISFYDNIPLLGYIRLRGKCRWCKSSISPIYPLLELFTALATIYLVMSFNSWILCTAWIIFLTVGLSLTVIDVRSHRLPNVLTLPLYLILCSVLVLDSIVNSMWSSFFRALFLSAALCFFYLLLNIISKGGMGLGDAKFALSVGLLAGYVSGFTVIGATFVAFFLGALVGVIAMLAKKGNRKTAIPFGPFIFLGTLLAPWLSPLLLQLL